MPWKENAVKCIDSLTFAPHAPDQKACAVQTYTHSFLLHIIASHIKSIKAHICQTGGILHPFSGCQLEQKLLLPSSWNSSKGVGYNRIYCAFILASLTNGNWKDKRSCITNLNRLLIKQPHPEALLSGGASLQPFSVSVSENTLASLFVIVCTAVPPTSLH